MREGIAIHASRVEKTYRLYGSPVDRLIESISIGRPIRHEEIHALKPLSFNIFKGETVGIVGRNGSGKSTLLQIICGTLEPSNGRVEVSGRIGALLELGSGFNPEFTGIENIYMNGSILGLSTREIDARMDDILGFADIGGFVRQPVRTYSSGMVVRLAFSVQACIDPEILVIDEALAVGDEIFQKKCFNRLRELKEKGTSILFVSHSATSIVQHCDRAIMLDQGNVRWIGRPDVTTTLYQRLNNSSERIWSKSLIQLGQRLTKAKLNSRDQYSPSDQEDTDIPERIDNSVFFDQDLRPESYQQYPDNGIKIEKVAIKDSDNLTVNTLPPKKGFTIRFKYSCQKELNDVVFSCHISNQSGVRICGQIYPGTASKQVNFRKGDIFYISFKFEGGLLPGLYFVGGGIRTRKATDFVHRVLDITSLRIINSQDTSLIGLCNMSSGSPLLEMAGGDGKE
ncbi:MAG: ABC transporter ATP-binding protein [Synechococcus sp. XM-24]|nr:MAG: ABC transporter ATP-binding protein [Synechococcus sp. XM-24]